MNVTLFYAPGACSLAVHVVLEWIGAPYEAVAVDQHAPEYRSINPAGAVPALRHDDGPALTQAGAILHFLARRHPEADLLDESSLEAAAELDRWSAFITGDLHPSFFPLFTPQRYTVDQSDDALAAVRRAGLELVRTKLALLEEHMEGRQWITGGKRTILDAYVLPMLRWASAKLPDGLAQFPALRTHRGMMLSDDAVRRVMETEGLSHA